MVYDCFCFFNELKLLEVRLEELNPVVDVFVLVESTRTFTGNPKALHFQNNKHLFSKHADKIQHIVVDELPPATNPHGMPNVFSETLSYGDLRTPNQMISFTSRM